MLWDVQGTPIPENWLDFQPVRVLYDYDGPKIFTCRDITDQLCLAVQCSADRDTMRHIVVPFSESLEWQLTRGDINVRDVLLARPRMWVFDLNNQWIPVRCWRVRPDDLPPRVLPKPGVMLWPDLQPVMSQTVARPAATQETYHVSCPSRSTFAGAW